MKFTALLLTFAAALYADGIRQSSGPVGQHTPSAGSHSRERIDGQYSAMPSGGANEVQGLSASGQVDSIAVLPIDGAGMGGGVTDLPQPLRPAVSPEPAAWLLVAGGLLMVWLGRKEGKT